MFAPSLYPSSLFPRSLFPSLGSSPPPPPPPPSGDPVNGYVLIEPQTGTPAFLVQCNQFLVWTLIQDIVSNAYVTDAAISYVITGIFTSGTSISGSLTYTGSNGTYRGLINATTAALFIPGNTYQLTLTLTSPSGYADERVVTFPAANRGLI